ncbi:MAG TPA: DUF87 domain-containing protein [Pseudomonadales bacterium]
MQDFEKLGAFYLGRLADREPPELLLYDSKDLTTHAVIVGMTGSGKTGLGIALIEEAAIDHVPVVAIDPKGDLGNLLLTFPELRAADFEPWIDPRAALEAGVSPAEHAGKVAESWRRGLAEWGQTPERITKLAAAAERRLYTPGSNAGRPLSALATLAPPGGELRDDVELYRETVDATAASLLTLVGVAAESPTSREQVLLANVLDHAWSAGQALDLAGLVAAVQSPPFARIGVVDVDSFLPAAARFELAMRFNALLASPGFSGWLDGPPLDIDALFYTDAGKPCVSVLSIAHLDEAGRLFFVAMLLGRLIAWMRRQPGTPALRAMLYMDEVFGFMPPVASPPTKRLLLTLLKQARAYGLGVVLSTQNPVDLDYKGLANAGTWFIGRMQTERDKARVIEGLKSAAGGERFRPDELEATISSLGKRRFLMHNVHEAEPAVFETRWVMSYLAGPMTREQIRSLTPAADGASSRTASAAAASIGPVRAPSAVASRPVLSPKIPQRFVPVDPQQTGAVVYQPRLIAAGDVTLTDARLGIDERRPFLFAVEVDDDTAAVDWTDAEALPFTLTELDDEPVDGAGFAACPAALTKPQQLEAAAKTLKRWLRDEMAITVWKSPQLRETSQPGETEAQFRIRLQHKANERRDAEVAKLRARYESKVDTLTARLRRAEHALEREQQQASGQRIDVVISIGTAVLGALFGRKRISVTSASRVGTAVRKAGRTRKEAGDVERAAESVEAVRQQLAELEQAFERDVDALDTAYDAQTEPLETRTIKPKTSGLHVDLIGVGWLPVAVGEAS